ncbi:MAG: metallophosphoesterase family protein [Clostridiales bacterium]|nr:metallophosphoesterase family protein [Clostridiales bacterium]
MDIENLISLKHTLRFNSDGKFKILMISDIHAGVGFNKKTPIAIKALVDECKPDLVIFNGDVAGPGRVAVQKVEEVKNMLDVIAAPMEDAHIPWAHVFGNHDDNGGLSNELQEPVYETYPYCLSKHGPADVDGASNYVLPIKAHDSEKILFNLWGLDSHDNIEKFKKAYGLPDDFNPVLTNNFCFDRGYDTVHFNQVVWYYEASKALEEYNGAKIPGLMYMHIPVPEMTFVYRNRMECGFEGTAREDVGCGEMNSGLFSACIQRGDVKAMFFGHDHVCDFTGTYCGMLMGYDAGIGYDTYGDNDLRGGRVFELSEDDPANFKTYMVRIRDVLGAAGDKTSEDK